jgi:WD40 repeat protein
VWNTLTGEELLTLEGHKNVVYAIAFNNPFGDKIVTGACAFVSNRRRPLLSRPLSASDVGSFDKTAKIWKYATALKREVACDLWASFSSVALLAAQTPGSCCKL